MNQREMVVYILDENCDSLAYHVNQLKKNRCLPVIGSLDVSAANAFLQDCQAILISDAYLEKSKERSAVIDLVNRAVDANRLVVFAVNHEGKYRYRIMRSRKKEKQFETLVETLDHCNDLLSAK